jgi:hypothetical protein
MLAELLDGRRVPRGARRVPEPEQVPLDRVRPRLEPVVARRDAAASAAGTPEQRADDQAPRLTRERLARRSVPAATRNGAARRRGVLQRHRQRPRTRVACEHPRSVTEQHRHDDAVGGDHPHQQVLPAASAARACSVTRASPRARHTRRPATPLRHRAYLATVTRAVNCGSSEEFTRASVDRNCPEAALRIRTGRSNVDFALERGPIRRTRRGPDKYWTPTNDRPTRRLPTLHGLEPRIDRGDRI